MLVWALRGKEIKKTSAYCVINSTHKPLSLSLFFSVLFLFLSPYFGFSFLLLKTFTMCFFNSPFCMGNRLELIMTVGWKMDGQISFPPTVWHCLLAIGAWKELELGRLFWIGVFSFLSFTLLCLYKRTWQWLRARDFDNISTSWFI